MKKFKIVGWKVWVTRPNTERWVAEAKRSGIKLRETANTQRKVLRKIKASILKDMSNAWWADSR